MKNLIITMLVICTVQMQLQAQGIETLKQQKRSKNVSFSAGVDLAVPRNEFAQAFPKKMFGFNANLSIPLGKRSPFEIGADYRFHHMGSAREDILIRQEVSEPGVDPITLEHNGKLKVKSNMHTLHGQLRLRPVEAVISPYIDGLAGVHFTDVKRRLSSIDPSFILYETERLDPKKQFAFSYGAAVGTQIKLKRNLGLDLKWSYLLGSKSRYPDPNTFKIDGESLNVEYDIKESRTDMMNFTVGLTF